MVKYILKLDGCDFSALKWIRFLSHSEYNPYLVAKSLKPSVDLSLLSSMTKYLMHSVCTCTSSHTDMLSWLNFLAFLLLPELLLQVPPLPISSLEWSFSSLKSQLKPSSQISLPWSSSLSSMPHSSHTLEKTLLYIIYKDHYLKLFTCLWIYCLTSPLENKHYERNKQSKLNT